MPCNKQLCVLGFTVGLCGIVCATCAGVCTAVRRTELLSVCVQDAATNLGGELGRCTLPIAALSPSCRCSDSLLAQSRKQVAKKSTSFRPGSGQSSPSPPVLSDAPPAGRAAAAQQHR